jgi:Tfp pilus assembly protein FimT
MPALPALWSTIENRKSKMENGVTLIEVIMIIAIIGMLAAMSIPRIGSLDERTAYTTARRIVADMRYARRLAITTAKNHIVRFSPAGGPYTEYRIFKDDGGEVQVGESRQIPERVTCTGTEELTFQPFGNASSDGAVSLSAGTDQYDVNIIAATGRVY